MILRFFTLVAICLISVLPVSYAAEPIPKMTDAQEIDLFYKERDGKPVWLRGSSSFQPRAEGVVSLLEQSGIDGLSPETYRVSTLREYLSGNIGENRAALDRMLTESVVRYAKDMSGLRGNTSAAERSIRYWREPIATKTILSDIASSSNPVSKLRDLAPKGNFYEALRQELAALETMPDEPFEPVKIGSVLKPGQSHPSVPALRQRLGLSDDGSPVYDDQTASAIMKLQRRNNLIGDGVIGPATLAAINRSKADRMAQVRANMERLRWVDGPRPDRYILVNIPSASLWAVDQGKTEIEMPVIVGKPTRKTYSFKTEITGVRFNPNWTVPPTIKREDFLPMLAKDPLALAKRGIRIMHNGEVIDPEKVDWTSVSQKSMNNLRMVQSPGEDNPLGYVRVIMDNPYSIYLHDTNRRENFATDDRALSSGCVRVAEPLRLANFILAHNQGWSWDKMNALIDTGKVRDISAAKKLPVYFTYQTMWFDSAGNVVYGKDIYGEDKKLTDVLQKSDKKFAQKNT